MGFFEDLSKKASETYKNTAEKTNKLTREMKLKSLINDDKNKIEKIYAEIGKKVYEKHIREENIDIKAELYNECSKIDAYAKEIEDMNTEMRSLKDLRLCSKCGAEISLKAKFCPSCGSKQEEIKTGETVNKEKVPAEAKEVEEVKVEETDVEEPVAQETVENVGEQTSALEETIETSDVQDITENVIENEQQNVSESNND
ncbi:MAG: zinc ribbon domain-containing protein [Clostridia bacterium]|nr:zinc ribbon domain-containing protein [Clostridia bacterium]